MTIKKGATIDEEILVQRIHKGESTALKELYSHYAGYLTAVCFRYIGNSEDVNDVLQDSFIKIFTSFDKFTYRGEGSLKAWMSRIVVNESLNKIRQIEKINFITPTWDLPDQSEEDMTQLEEVPISTIYNMIKEMPIGYRTVFNLYVFEEKSHKEIAKILAISEGASASQLHRAKGFLAQKIKEFESVKLLQNG